MTRLAAVLAVAVLALAPSLPALAAPLTVCLEQDTPPYSYRHDGKPAGFDVAVAGAVAQRLGRGLKIQWFEVSKTPDNDEPDPARAENGLLSIGRCELVGGFMLIANDLTPPATMSALPDFQGMTRSQRKLQVPIGPLLASKPYNYFSFTVLLGPKAGNRKIASLADLQGLRIASEDGTLADAMLMWYGNRRYLRLVTHYTPAKTIDHGGGLLEHLDRGDFDVTLVPLRRFDVYRLEHPDTKIVPTGYYYHLGFNIGFVARHDNKALIDHVNGAIDDLIAKKELPVLAKAEHMTYVAPRGPAVSSGVSLGDLVTEDR